MINGINLEPFGKSVMSEIKGHFETNPLFRDMFSAFCPKKNAKWDTQYEFTVPNRKFPHKEPTCLIGSFGSPRTGHHYEYIINDDPHNEENTQNIEQITKIVHCWEAQEPLGIGQQTCRFQVATFWHHADLNNHMINLLSPQFRASMESGERNHNVNVLTKKSDDRDRLKIYLLDIYDRHGESIWPERLPNSELDRKKMKMGIRFFKMQYQNMIIAAEEQTFRPEYFRYYKVIHKVNEKGITEKFYVCGQKRITRGVETPVFIERLIPANDVVVRITVDPAYTVKDYSDECAIVTVGHWTDPETRLPWYIVLDYESRKMEPAESMRIIEEKVEEFNAREVGIEAHGATMYINQILGQARWAGSGKVRFVPIRRSTMSKELRVMRLQAPYQSGRIWHANHMMGGKLENTLKAFVGGAFVGARDDLADALSDQVDFPGAPGMTRYDPMERVTKSYGTWDDDYGYVGTGYAPDWETL